VGDDRGTLREVQSCLASPISPVREILEICFLFDVNPFFGKRSHDGNRNGGRLTSIYRHYFGENRIKEDEE
jgi:hypothetical protein